MTMTCRQMAATAFMAAIALTLVLPIRTTLAAQSASTEEIRKVLANAVAVAKQGDKAEYGRYLADDLRWMGVDGTIHAKQDRLARLGAGGGPTWSDIDIKVIGDTALVTAIATSADGRRSRATRTLMKLDGRWQLVLHGETALK